MRTSRVGSVGDGVLRFARTAAILLLWYGSVEVCKVDGFAPRLVAVNNPATTTKTRGKASHQHDLLRIQSVFRRGTHVAKNAADSFFDDDKKSREKLLLSSEVVLELPDPSKRRRDVLFEGKPVPRRLSASLALLCCSCLFLLGGVLAAYADSGASSSANAKIAAGGASTSTSGRTIVITRGVNLDNSDFGGQNLKGVAFQQSIVRDCNFKDSNLVGASFFDATLDGSDFTNSDMSQANVEMAQFNRAVLKNTVIKEAYVSGATLFEGVKDIEGSDWTDTYLRADQKKYLCNHPTAKGTNPTTGADTRESLMCLD